VYKRIIKYIYNKIKKNLYIAKNTEYKKLNLIFGFKKSTIVGIYDQTHILENKQGGFYEKVIHSTPFSCDSLFSSFSTDKQ